VIDQVLEAYPGKVKYVVKHFPLGFHQQATPAAKALLAAEKQGKFYEMLNVVLDNNHQLSAEKFIELAQGIGLNVDQFKKDLEENDAEWGEWIQDDFSLGTKVDVRGTPTYFLNGKKTIARTLGDFQKEIDAILGEKK
jgi:protein-disulfide isomerase